MYTFSQVRALLPGQFLYEPRFELGTGGLGRVDAVQVVASNRSCAVGTYLARKRLNAAWSRDPDAQARFDRERKILAVMDHPNIVPLQGINTPGGEQAYFMPLYPGSVRSTLASGQPWSLTSVVRLGIVIARALSYAHGLGFTHRDLKPDNILLDGQGAPVLCDWGLGQFIHQHSTVLLTRNGPMGTGYYCDLEQWRSGNGGIQGDIYSLGMTLGELAHGTALPIQHIGFGIEQDVIRSISPTAQRFNQIIRRMTCMLRDRRYNSMDAVADTLSYLVVVH